MALLWLEPGFEPFSPGVWELSTPRGHLICCGRRVSRVIVFGWGSRAPASQPENALPERLQAAAVIAY